MSNIHIVIGTKAQLIKMWPIMKELESRGISYNYIRTWQHQETMLELEGNFGIKSHDSILHKGKDITWIFQMFLWVIKILWKTIFQKKNIFGSNPQWIVLVHWDTFSTLLWALMWKFSWLKVWHIESWLRSYNLLHPFPEELTRLLVFQLSNYYFCPWERAIQNVKKYKWKKINTKLNTLYDSLQIFMQKKEEIDVEIPTYKYAICSLHRFENIFSKKILQTIIDQVEMIAIHTPLLFIMHIPTRERLQKYDLYKRIVNNKNIEIRPRYDYLKFIKLVYNSEFVVTDGWSNQEECAYLGKPALLMRRKTERQEWIGENAVLSNYDVSIIQDFLDKIEEKKCPPFPSDDSPTHIIVENLLKDFS